MTKKPQIIKIKNEIGDVTSNVAKIKRILEHTMNGCMPSNWVI